MFHQFTYLFILITSIYQTVYAYVPEEGKITASYNLFLQKTNFNRNESIQNIPVFLDFGLTTAGDLHDSGSLEISIYHLNKIYYRNQTSRYLSEQTELIQISTGYRHWLSETISLGLGLAAGYSLGDYKTVHSDSGLDLEIDTSARDTTEYGLNFSLQKEFWSNNEEALTLDMHYLYSISKKENESADHIMLGLSFRRVIQQKSNKSEINQNNITSKER